MSKVLLPTGHMHSYVRSRQNKNIFRCVHPDCTHYHQKDFLEGKRAVCSLCGETFILDRIQLRNRVPRCEDCKQGKEKGKITELSKELEKILGGDIEND
jgi:formylmethanofuran dehydrogenase subunit E